MVFAFEDVAFRLFGFLWAYVNFTARRMVLVSISENHLITQTLIPIFRSNLQGIIPLLLVHWVNLFHIFHNNNFVGVGRNNILSPSFLFKHYRKAENWIFFHEDLN